MNLQVTDRGRVLGDNAYSSRATRVLLRKRGIVAASPSLVTSEPTAPAEVFAAGAP